MKQSRKSFAIILCTSLLLLSGCAVFKKQAPQLPPALANELNVADQLQQLNRDYKTFFTDVGIAHRDGQLTDSDVTTLNAAGERLQTAIEHGNRAFKLWQSNRADQAQFALVTAAIQEGTALFLDLTTKKGQMQARSLHERRTP